MIREIKMTCLKFSNMKKADSVVIVCAGPSLSTYKKEVVNYIKENHSLVISANYNHAAFGIKSDYTYITDQNKLIENISLIESNLVIPAKMKTDYNLDKIKKVMNRYKGVKFFISHKFFNKPYSVYKIGGAEHNTVYSDSLPIKMNKNGEFRYRRLGSAGQGSVLLSVLCRPKKILIVGLDGPLNIRDKEISKELYDGSKIAYDKDKFYRIANFIESKMIPFIASRNIVIETFNDVNFYGIDKSKMGIKIL